MKTGCIIQARMTSTRLPGKVLRVLDYRNGTSILEEVIARVRAASGIDQVIVATTENADDDPVVSLCEKLGVTSFRGSEYDVLSRYYHAAAENSLDTIIRITSDCPFLDPAVITDLIRLYSDGGYDYAGNGMKRTYPHGLDCEIFSMAKFEDVYRKTTDRFYREHVTSYFYSHPDEFRLGSLELSGEDYHDIRVTVDTPQDYVLACVVKDMLPAGSTSFRDIVRLYEEKPYLRMINGDVLQKKKYDSRSDELAAAVSLLKLQEMNEAASAVEEALAAETDRN